jgi:hypothetical protein
MKLKDENNIIKERLLKEELQYIKFKYDGKNNTIKYPKVKVLDPYYPGQPNQKSFGKRDDILGWSLSHVANKKYALKAIDDITDFAKLLSADSYELYQRIKYFYPEQSTFIRRYIKDGIKGIKEKKPDNFFWKKIKINDLAKFEEER